MCGFDVLLAGNARSKWRSIIKALDRVLEIRWYVHNTWKRLVRIDVGDVELFDEETER